MKKLILLFLLFGLVQVGIQSATPKIILKLDDLRISKNGSASSATLEYLKQKGVKAGFGIIANGVDETALSFLTPYINATNAKGEKLFEFWHHGYDHKKPEFKATGYDYQKHHFEKADSLFENSLGIKIHSFGAPFNASDSITIRVMSENPKYKVIMLGSIIPARSTAILNLNQRVNLELSPGVPDSAYFVTNYLASKSKYSNYMIVQAHPPYFKPERLDEFKKVIEFLIREGCEFVLPYEYYKTTTIHPIK